MTAMNGEVRKVVTMRVCPEHDNMLISLKRVSMRRCVEISLALVGRVNAWRFGPWAMREALVTSCRVNDIGQLTIIIDRRLGGHDSTLMVNGEARKFPIY